MVITIFSILIQFSLSELTPDLFLWEESPGWKLYLSIYNFVLIFIILYVLILNDKEILKFLVKILIFFSLVIGGFNLISMIIIGHLAVYNIIMVFIHFIAMILGIYFFYLVKKKIILNTYIVI